MFDIGKIIDRLLAKDSVLADIFKGKERKLLELQREIQKEYNEVNKQQIEVNKIEAQHQNIFVSGWRPACGWVCVLALAYSYAIQPFIVTILSAFKVSVVAPTLEMGQLITILLGMLGLGAYRTIEKIKINK